MWKSPRWLNVPAAEQREHVYPDLTRQILLGVITPQEDDPLRIFRGQIEVAAAHRLEKAGVLALDAVARLTGAFTRAGEPGRDVHIEEVGPVRPEPPGRNLVEARQEVPRNGAPAPLIRERRVRKAIADNDLTRFEGGPDPLGNVLGPSRYKE
jgi:hypothetical protein